MDGIALASTGEHPALNFLNTRLRPWGEQLDLLDDGRAFTDWLVASGLIDEGERRRILRGFTAVELDEAAARARELREWLRGAVEAWAGDGASREPVPAATLKRLNRILVGDPQHLELVETSEGVRLRSRRAWADAGQLLGPVAASAAELFAEGDPALVRMCDGPRCRLWFYDRTRSHRRRWCSQAVCGNRDKVRNHRARQAVR